MLEGLAQVDFVVEGGFARGFEVRLWLAPSIIPSMSMWW